MSNNYADRPFSPAKFPVFYGWFIVFFATLGVLMSIPGQTIGVSAFKEHLISALGVENSQLSLAYLVGTISSGFLLTYAGKFYDRHGVRIVAACASLGLGMVLISLSQAEIICGFLTKNSPFSAQATILIFMAVGFFFLRFFGQGILTMVSRNMMMKWFRHRRGLVNGISGIFVTMGFASAPKFFNSCINFSSWQQTWLFTGIFASFIFVLVILIFFRDNPEACGLVEDGRIISMDEDGKVEERACKKLNEAVRTYSFWPFLMAFCMSALYVTAATFHIEDIFKGAGMDREQAFGIFVPSGIIGVFVNFFFGWVSDKVKLKYVNLVLLSGLLLSMIGVLCLKAGISYYLIILGHGLAGGTFTLLMSVTWPRFYGRTFLGEISGFAMSALVIASALGPWLLSLSKSSTDSYNGAIYILAIATVFIMIATLKAERSE